MDKLDADPHAVDELYVCTLDAVTEQKAIKELNEDPKDRLNAVRALRTWLLQQPHITFPTDTRTLLAFLRTSKFSQLRAREMIENNARAACENARWLQDIDPCAPEIMKVIDSGYSVVLPNKDKNGCPILIYRTCVTTDGGKLFSIDDEIRASMVVSTLAALDENFQVNGFVFIIDMTGATTKHLTKWKLEDVKRWNGVWQKSFPGRFKEFHYYNCGSIFEAMMAMARPFLSKKFQERIHVHDTMESLYKMIDMKLLPKEYLPDDYTGPNSGSLTQIIADIKRQVTTKKFRDEMLERTSRRYGIDESKRPAFKQVNESFRKLSVD